MIAVMVHHLARDGAEVEGLKMIRTSGAAMKSFPGFRSRHVMVGRDDKHLIATVTVWDSDGDYVKWTQSDVNRGIVRPPGIWTTKPEPVMLDVVPN